MDVKDVAKEYNEFEKKGSKSDWIHDSLWGGLQLFRVGNKIGKAKSMKDSLMVLFSFMLIIFVTALILLTIVLVVNYFK